MFLRKLFVDEGTVTVPKLKEISHFLKEKENVTILWLPGGGRTTFGIDLQNRPILTKVTSGRRLKRIIFIYIDLRLDSLQLDAHLNEALGNYSTLSGIRNKIGDIVSKGYWIYFILDNIELRTLKSIDYMLTLRSANSQKVKFINLMLENDFHEISRSENKLPSSFFHNVVKIPYFDKEETLKWLSISARGLRMRIRPTIKENIYQNYGGIPVMLKNCLRSVKSYSGYEQAAKSLEMRGIVNTYWKKLTLRERHVIINAYKRSPLPNYPEEINYLREHRVLNPDYSFDKGWIRFVDELHLQSE